MDPGTAGLLAGGVSAIGGIYNTSKQFDIHREQLAFQRRKDLENQAFAREGWARDDNAIQRRMQDLENAGMSPLLAAGAAAGNSPAPHNEATGSGIVPQFDSSAVISAILQGVNATKTVKDIENQDLQTQADVTVKTAKAEQILAKTEEDTEKHKHEYKGTFWLTERGTGKVLTKAASLATIKAYMTLHKLDALKYNIKKSRDFGVRTNDPSYTHLTANLLREQALMLKKQRGMVIPNFVKDTIQKILMGAGVFKFMKGGRKNPIGFNQ